MTATVAVTMTVDEYAGALFTQPITVAGPLATWVTRVCAAAGVAADGWTSIDWTAEHSHLFGAPPHPDIDIAVRAEPGHVTVVTAPPPPLPAPLLEVIAAR